MCCKTSNDWKNTSDVADGTHSHTRQNMNRTCDSVLLNQTTQNESIIHTACWSQRNAQQKTVTTHNQTFSLYSLLSSDWLRIHITGTYSLILPIKIMRSRLWIYVRETMKDLLIRIDHSYNKLAEHSQKCNRFLVCHVNWDMEDTIHFSANLKDASELISTLNNQFIISCLIR